MLGQRRLAQVHALGGAAEAPGPGDGQEDLELAHGRFHKSRLIGADKNTRIGPYASLGATVVVGAERRPAVDLTNPEVQIRLSAFVACFAVLAVAEALAPRRRRLLGRRERWGGNLGLVVVDTIVVRLVPPVTAVGVAALAEARGWGMLHATGPWPAWLGVLVSVVWLDFAIYLQHVLFHAVPALWRLHRVHHTDLDLDVSTGVRFHPVEILLSVGFKAVAVAALGPPVAGVVLFEVRSMRARCSATPTCGSRPPRIACCARRSSRPTCIASTTPPTRPRRTRTSGSRSPGGIVSSAPTTRAAEGRSRRHGDRRSGDSTLTSRWDRYRLVMQTMAQHAGCSDVPRRPIEYLVENRLTSQGVAR